MSKRADAEDALTFVREHGVVLVSAKGPAPRLTEAIVREPIAGSWWAHRQSHRIHAIIESVTGSEQVLVCRLINDKVTLIHRRLWPAFVRLGKRFGRDQLAQVREEHTSSGRHVTRRVPFPRWVPRDVLSQGKAMDEREALAAVGRWVPAQGPGVRQARGGNRGR